MGRDCHNEQFLVRVTVHKTEREPLDQHAARSSQRRCTALRMPECAVGSRFHSGLEPYSGSSARGGVVLNLMNEFSFRLGKDSNWNHLARALALLKTSSAGMAFTSPRS